MASRHFTALHCNMTPWESLRLQTALKCDSFFFELILEHFDDVCR